MRDGGMCTCCCMRWFLRLGSKGDGRSKGGRSQEPGATTGLSCVCSHGFRFQPQSESDGDQKLDHERLSWMRERAHCTNLPQVVMFCCPTMATAMRSTGCCAIANTASLRQTQNTSKQDRWKRSSSIGCRTGAMLVPSATGLTSELFCNKKCFMPKNGSRRNFRVGRVNPIRSKMFVPGFGEASPEAQAAAALHNFFTYVAVKIVASQLEDYNKEAYVDLMDFLEKTPLKDGDKFIAQLMRESFRHKNLGKWEFSVPLFILSIYSGAGRKKQYVPNQLTLF
ncbi:hypothetical protein M758_5G113200 [Ceratodon purpureus]|nr:hypothetical protein M758_5G113200 [Ceratodon purpureus]